MVVTEPIRVAQIVGPVVLGGVDTMVMNYYRNVDRNKVQFDFIMDGYDETPIDDEILALGGHVYKVEPYTENMLRSMRQYYQIFKKNHYSVVHSHMNALSIFPLYEAWRAGVPVRIAHSHSTAVKSEGKKTTMKYALRPFAKVFPTHCCACSEYAGKWLFGDDFYSSGAVRLVKNAVNVDHFSYCEETRRRVRSELNLDSRLVVGHVGRFVYQKNHSFLIDIFAEIHSKNENTILLLVGDGPLRLEMNEKVERLGLKDSVRFLGLRRDVSKLMQAMDVFLLPSFYEGLPVVGVEAQTAGLPCVLSDAMTKETKITELASFMSLSQSPEEWAGRVLACSDYDRVNMDGVVRTSGFDIEEEAKKLERFYLNIS